MNDDDEDDDAVEGIISEAVARAVEPLAARLDAIDRKALLGVGSSLCIGHCTCGYVVNGRSAEAMIFAYRDHTLYAHGLINLVLVQ